MSLPTFTLNNGVTIPAIGYGVFQTPPDETVSALPCSPIWNVRPPMTMRTFLDGFEMRGTTIHPFVTYPVSCIGASIEEYTQLCLGASIDDGIAVRGDKARDGEADVTVMAAAREPERVNSL